MFAFWVFWLEGWRFDVLITVTSFTVPTKEVGGKKNLQTLAKHWAFEKLPLARNQQGAVRSWVAKSCEDPDHMGCTLVSEHQEMSRIFPPTSCSRPLFPGPENKQDAFSLCKITVFFFLKAVRKRWRELPGSPQGEESQERRKQDLKASYRRQWGWELLGRETVSMDSGDEDEMWTTEK